MTRNLCVGSSDAPRLHIADRGWMTGSLASWRVLRAILGESAGCGEMRAGVTACSEMEVLKADMRESGG